jgi:hypothetical protein
MVGAVPTLATKDKQMKSIDIKNLDEQTLQQFERCNNGLLTPEGKLLPVDQYQHFESLKAYEPFGQMIEEFEEYISEEANNFIEGIDPDEHPEWHRFEIFEMGEQHDFRMRIMGEAYKKGWGRIGCVVRRGEPVLLELETSSETARTLTPYAQCVAELLNCELKVTETDQFERDLRR